MRASRRKVNTHSYLLSAVSAALVVASEGFLGSVPRLSTAATTPAGRRCRVPRLALTPPGKRGSGAGAGAGSAAAGGEESGKTASSNRITRAPLRITPNFQPQEKRRPKTDVHRDMAYGAFLTEKSFDIAGESVQRYSVVDAEAGRGTAENQHQEDSLFGNYTRHLGFWFVVWCSLCGN